MHFYVHNELLNNNSDIVDHSYQIAIAKYTRKHNIYIYVCIYTGKEQGMFLCACCRHAGTASLEAMQGVQFPERNSFHIYIFNLQYSFQCIQLLTRFVHLFILLPDITDYSFNNLGESRVKYSQTRIITHFDLKKSEQKLNEDNQLNNKN